MLSLVTGVGILTSALAGETASVGIQDLLTEIKAESGDAVVANEEVAEPRRRVSTWLTERNLERHVCGGSSLSAGQYLLDIAEELEGRWNSGYNKCDAMKALILPKLRGCLVSNSNPTMTLYAGFTFDGSLIVKGASAVGAYLDSTGRTGCFSTTCWGAGLNFGAGGGVVAGLLLGDAANDFPGVGFGAEFGGDFGPGADFAGGATTSGIPYVEVSVGHGIGVAAGVHRCNTDTELANQGTFFSSWGLPGRR